MEFQNCMPFGLQKIIEAYKMFAVNGILFNHESERRGETFVTRKISLAVARIYKGVQKALLGEFKFKKRLGLC